MFETIHAAINFIFTGSKITYVCSSCVDFLKSLQTDSGREWVAFSRFHRDWRKGYFDSICSQDSIRTRVRQLFKHVRSTAESDKRVMSRVKECELYSHHSQNLRLSLLSDSGNLSTQPGGSVVVVSVAMVRGEGKRKEGSAFNTENIHKIRPT